MKVLTDFGVKDPVELMDIFHKLGQEALVTIMESTSSPETRKQLRTWGAKDASDMIGRSRSSIIALEEKGILPLPEKDAQGRKQYSLELINMYRDAFKTRYHRPKDTDPIVCCSLNFKGGSGKTITSLLLSQYLAIQGLKVLAVDLDPQATFTTYFGYIPDIDLHEDETLVKTLLEDETDISNIIKKTYFTGIDILPANLELDSAEIELPNFSDAELQKLGSPLKRLDKALDRIKDNYDVVIIDCPPKTGAITVNAVASINSCLLTIPPSMPDFASFVRLTKVLKKVFKALKQGHIDFLRILLTKHKGNMAANKMDQLIRSLYGAYTLVNHMVDSAEVDNTANALISLYEKSYATNGATYKRAIETCNNVNNEIFDAFKVIWDANTSLEKGI
ncbi:AAA family ATPase [Francisellaceae bacterium]|nr:AAA family ATPase [Francisellaceae bacterium]